MAGRRRVAALAAALALVATASPATAHRGDPNVVSRLDAVEPPIEGVVVEVRAGVADQLLVVNTTADPVEVIGRTGTPFLRIGRDSVEADVSSADWRESLGPFGTAATSGTGSWVTVARHGSWGWFDHRLHPEDRTLPPAVLGSRRPVRLADWTVPLRHRGTTHVVKGHVEYRPVAGRFRSHVTKAPDGVEVDVLDGRVPGLFVRLRGRGTLVVRGIEGEPFARLSASRAEVNRASATWRDDQALRGNATGTPATAEEWVPAGPAPTLTWLDRRLAYAPGVVPDDVLRRTEPTTMVEWDIPVTFDGNAAAISGETTWHPSAREAGRRWPGYVAAAGLAVVLLVTYVTARGRRRRHVEP